MSADDLNPNGAPLDDDLDPSHDATGDDDFDDDFDPNADIDTLPADELREEVRSNRVRLRRMTAELAGRTHALNALESRLAGVGDGWLEKVLAEGRHRQQTRGPATRHPSRVVNMGTRLREVFQELQELGERLQELEEENAFNLEKMSHTDAWLEQLRQEGRVPEYSPGDIERLHIELDGQRDRVGFLEEELQRKADAVGEMLNRVARAEDHREEAVQRYKSLIKQQERIASAFQEQAKRAKAIKAENDALKEELDAFSTDGDVHHQIQSLQAEIKRLKVEPRRAPSAGDGPSESAAVSKLEAKLRRAIDTNKAAKAYVEATRTKLQTAEDKLAKSVAHGHALEADREQIQSKLSALRREHMDASGEVHGAKEDVAVAEARVVQLEMAQKESEEFQTKLRHDRARAEEKARALEGEVEELQATVAEAERLITVSQGKAKRVQETLDRQSIQLDAAQAELNAAREQKSKLEAGLQKTLSEGQEAATALAEQKEELSTLKAALDAAQGKLEASQGAQAKAESAKKAAEQTLHALHVEVESIKEARYQADRSQIRVEGKLRETEAALELLRSERHAAVEAKAELEQALASAQGEIEGFQAERSAGQRSQWDLERRLEEAQSQREVAEALSKEAQSEVETLVNARHAAESKALAAEERTQDAAREVERSQTALRASQTEIDELATRLKGAEAHRQALEERVGGQAKAESELNDLRAQQEAGEAERSRLFSQLSKTDNIRSALTAELTSLRTELDGLKKTNNTLKDEAEESRERSMQFREDLRLTRQAIGELTEERDRALAIGASGDDHQAAVEAMEAQWQREREDLERQLDRLHEEAAELRQQNTWRPRPSDADASTAEPVATPGSMPPMPSDPFTSASPAAAEAPIPSELASLAPRPEGLTLDATIPESPRGPLPHTMRQRVADAVRDDAPAARQPQSLGEGPRDWRPKRATIPDEPYAPVDLETRSDRGVADPHSPTTRRRRPATQAGTSSRRQASETLNPLSVPKTRRRPTTAEPDQAWESLVANRAFRERIVPPTKVRGPAGGRPRKGSAEKKKPVEPPKWDRPIVDVEAEFQNQGPTGRAGAASTTSLPTPEAIRAHLSAGEVNPAHKKAKTLWKQNPASEESLSLFLEASKVHRSGQMEALAELDERIPPHRVSGTDAAQVARALMGAGLPGEALRYVLSPLRESEEPVSDPLFQEASNLLRDLREDGQEQALTKASLLTTLGSLPLSVLGPLSLHVSGFGAEPSPGGRPGDAWLYPTSNAQFPGISLAPGQGALLRALPAAGAHIDGLIFDAIEDANPTGSGKVRLSILSVPQAISTAVEKELKRLRRKRKHHIVPLTRAELTRMITGQADKNLLKIRIKAVG